MSEPILRVSNIETYYGPVAAIRGVSFDVPKGAIVTILGANGAGKSTVLKTVFGLMDAQRGNVTFAGRQIQGLDADKVMRLGMTLVPEGREVLRGGRRQQPERRKFALPATRSGLSHIGRRQICGR